jgi:hypothetical protein
MYTMSPEASVTAVSREAIDVYAVAQLEPLLLSPPSST